jgi:hypothetical protein
MNFSACFAPRKRQKKNESEWLNRIEERDLTESELELRVAKRIGRWVIRDNGCVISRISRQRIWARLLWILPSVEEAPR